MRNIQPVCQDVGGYDVKIDELFISIFNLLCHLSEDLAFCFYITVNALSFFSNALSRFQVLIFRCSFIFSFLPSELKLGDFLRPEIQPGILMHRRLQLFLDTSVFHILFFFSHSHIFFCFRFPQYERLLSNKLNSYVRNLYFKKMLFSEKGTNEEHLTYLSRCEWL